ncbi:uncharacterized protein LOC131236725 [Magnolia sinica]|uniref:uncharacterized protein LOC131236725 n=1 Tax=Magnolia sinica TaxID=86752 RepID=UPI00265A101D|nr:uncharacterized protein LOC131236725 [Magnolia sinica]
MDLWSLNLNNANRGLFPAKIAPPLQRHTWPERRLSCNFMKIGGFYGGEDEIKTSRSWRPAYRSLSVRAMGKKNHENSSNSGSSDQSIPEGNNPSSDNTKSEDAAAHKSHHTISDWRTFRATLVAREQLSDDDAPVQDAVSHESSKSLGAKWAHPIPVPETGCILVATEKLDGVRTFERTVVLLLRSGTKDPREGPFGVILNRPLNKKIKHMKPSNLDLATTFAECSLHFGGPLDASMFLLKTGEDSPTTGFEQVIPGLSFGARNSLDDAAELVKKGMLRPQDFRFFVGYAGWQLDQLRDEIESDYWFVAACSVNLISGLSTESSSGLWEEILQLMGGHYSELSRKPKQDSS